MKATTKFIAVADKRTERQEILQRIEKGFNKTLNSCIAVTLANYFDTITNIKENDFTKDIFTWYDNALKNWNM